MMVTQFFFWWYGRGWRDVLLSFGRRTQAVIASFSVKLLVGTLFAPWRRIVTHPGASLGDHFHAWLDNVVSRFIGFLIRFFVLLAAAGCIISIALLTALEAILWPLIPLAVLALLIMGVKG